MSPDLTHAAGDRCRIKSDNIALWLAALFLAVMLFFGPSIHPFETANTAENDDFVGKAALIARGLSPNDPYHSPLYHVLTAGTGLMLGGDFFAGGRVVSSFFAALAVWFAYRIGKRCFGTPAGFFAMAMTCLNSHIFVNGFLVTTDMTYTALALWAVDSALRMTDAPSLRAALVLALAFAVACFARQSAPALIPGTVLALLLCPASRDKKLKFTVLFVVSAVIFLAPQAFLTWKWYGHPLLNLQWKNLALRMYGTHGSFGQFIDWDYLFRPGFPYDKDFPFDGWLSVIWSSPSKFVYTYASEIAYFFIHNMALLFGGGFTKLGWVVVGAATVGMRGTLSGPDRKRKVLFGFIISYIFTSALFFTWPRYLILLIPMVAGFAGIAIFSIQRPVLRWAVIAALLTAQVYSAQSSLTRFRDQHPYKELEAAKRLEERFGKNIRVIATFRPLNRHVGNAIAAIPSLKYAEQQGYAAYTVRLHEFLKKFRVDFVIVGRLSAVTPLKKWVDGTSQPDYLELLERNEDVAIFRVN